MNIEDLRKPLKAEEIELRIGTTKQGKGFSLLLYKTVRTDRAILNSVVGALNWKSSFYNDSHGNVVCQLSIYDPNKKEWITKEDVGIESYTEKEKGSYSDAMKRAGFQWGIGEELYDAPFIWINWEEWSGKNPSCSFKIRQWRVENNNNSYQVFDEKNNQIFPSNKSYSKNPIKKNSLKFKKLNDDSIKLISEHPAFDKSRKNWINTIDNKVKTDADAQRFNETVKKTITNFEQEN